MTNQGPENSVAMTTRSRLTVGLWNWPGLRLPDPGSRGELKAKTLNEDQEQHIFGHGDEYLRCIEEHSNTFIQLEGWFTASGQTRVTVVGPFRAKHWLVDMIWNLCNQEAYHRAGGQEMLDLVRKQPLTRAHLDASLTVQARDWGLFLDIKDLVTTWD
eukprot:XP_017445428.1 PREDICTED: KH homology domain-containing protein 1-like [Rattus norvegicus]